MSTGQITSRCLKVQTALFFFAFFSEFVGVLLFVTFLTTVLLQMFQFKNDFHPHFGCIFMTRCVSTNEKNAFFDSLQHPHPHGALFLVFFPLVPRCPPFFGFLCFEDSEKILSIGTKKSWVGRLSIRVPGGSAEQSFIPTFSASADKCK